MPRRTPAPHPSLPATIRARLAELVAADGRMQYEIAQAAGMSPQQLWQVLSGHRTNPSVGTVAAILRAVGRTWADLD